MSDRRLHLNLIESSRQLFELDPNAIVQHDDGSMLGAGSHDHPAISNVAFRIDDELEADEFLAGAKDFFATQGRGFSVWIRGEQPEDRDLAATAERAGLQLVYSMPEMTLGKPVEAPALPDGAELSELSRVEQAEDYWAVASASYMSLGFPPETFAGYSDGAGLLAENVVAFIAYLDEEPVSIAMTIVSHGVAGIYWVGSLERARGKGLGRAVTAAATNAGFAMGAETASLQASHMGRPIYEEMGYEVVFDYRLFMAAPPS